MSGTMDNLQPAGRVAFTTILDGGFDAGNRPRALCITLANCQLPVPDQIWAMLNFTTPQTYAACAARATLYLLNGRVLGT